MEAYYGGIDIDAAAGKDVDIAGGQVALVSKDNVSNAISLTTNIGTDETIEIKNTQGTSNDAIRLQSQSGGVYVDAMNEVRIHAMNEVRIDAMNEVRIDAMNKVRIYGNGNGSDAIIMEAYYGGIDIDAAAGKDVDIAGGQVALVSKDNVSTLFP